MKKMIVLAGLASLVFATPVFAASMSHMKSKSMHHNMMSRSMQPNMCMRHGKMVHCVIHSKHHVKSHSMMHMTPRHPAVMQGRPAAPKKY